MTKSGWLLLSQEPAAFSISLNLCEPLENTAHVTQSVPHSGRIYSCVGSVICRDAVIPKPKLLRVDSLSADVIRGSDP